MNFHYLETIYQKHKVDVLFGKWITLKEIEPLIQSLHSNFEITNIGTSEENRPIYSLKIGSGSQKIMIWSQMHGNESTGTKAMFDLLQCFNKISDMHFNDLLKACTLLFVPMLNPDGAIRYTRENANHIDLNRDAVDKEAVESRILRTVLEEFNPKFCFNLHDQRTIFGVEGTQNPATISFLAPSEEYTRAITDGRKQTMNVIVAMNKILQQCIPNCVGRYSDEYYPTATGDTFQQLGFHTVLIESGHAQNDYNREESRKYTFYSILSGINHIAKASNYNEYQSYFQIPNNNKQFYDVIHRAIDPKKSEGYQYKDIIKNSTLVSFLEKIEDNDLENKIGHYEIKL